MSGVRANTEGSHRGQWMLGFLLVALAGKWLFEAYISEQQDLLVYLDAARRLLHGESLYGPRAALPFTYPPLAAILFVPLALLPNVAAATLWVGFNVGAAWWLLTRIFRAVPRPVLLLAVFTAPFGRSVYLGQINLLLFLFMWGAVAASPRVGGAGWRVGLAASLKLTPAFLALRYAVQGRWTQVLISAGTAVAGVVAAWAVSPDASHWYWTQGVWDVGRVGGSTYPDNQSVAGVLGRLAPIAPSTLNWVAAALVAAASVAAGWRWRAFPVESFTAVGLGALLAAPVSWSHHFLWLSVMIALLWRHGHAWYAKALLGLMLLEPIFVDGLLRGAPDPIRAVGVSNYAFAAIASLVYLCLKRPSDPVELLVARTDLTPTLASTNGPA